MNNKTKKRILTVALIISLLAIVMIGSSLAWFTAEEEVKNTFTVGSVEIQQIEQTYDENGALIPFTKGGMLTPIVDADEPSADPNYEHKMVTVKNTGRNGAYVRTHIAVPTALVGYLNIDVSVSGDWKFAYSNAGVIVDGESYNVYTYVYQNELTVGQTTPRLLNGVYLFPYVDLQENPETGKDELCKRDDNGNLTFSGFAVDADTEVNVLVATQAVQSAGFTAETGKTVAETALDEAFGVETHPFG